MRASDATYIVTLNDDAVAYPQWLSKLKNAAEQDEHVGMCASQVRLHGSGTLDSAGMLICADGSSKQRGHGESPEKYSRQEEVLLPSGSAALYRREMLEQLQGFDDEFFLYCEDTDLGLRARWAGWRCLYVPDAVVQHRYSHSAGRASALKAYYVERNRLFPVFKNFPAPQLLLAPLATIARYFWHLVAMVKGEGATAEFQRSGSGFTLVWFVLRAHIAALRRLPILFAQRSAIRANAKLSPAQFGSLLRRYAISCRQVASL
jgi:GT2 family glycosyltransferase